MPAEPTEKRTYAFFDGQNLFHAAKDAFGYVFPNFDPEKLAQSICGRKGWDLRCTQFYTGVPDLARNLFWSRFWMAKFAVMGTRRIVTFSRKLRYRNQLVTLPDGETINALVGQEKGIDVRIALDVVRLARESQFDVALIFSQDQDFSEVADEVKCISKSQNRWIRVASAFPESADYDNKRGINHTEWIKITKAEYSACIDPIDYRPKNKPGAD